MNYIKLGLFVAAIIILLLSCGEVTTSPELGDVPTDLEITKISTNNVKLTWLYANVNDDTLLFYIARKVGTNEWDEYYDQVDGDTFEYIDYINTSDNFVYAYKVRYYIPSTDEYSNFSEAVAYFSDYTAPTELVITQETQTEITLTWVDNCIGEEGFRIDKKINDENWDTKYLELPENTQTFSDYVALFDTLYYKIYAFSGISLSPVIQDSIFQTLSTPTDLTSTLLDENKIRLNWTDNSQQETGFYIDRKVGELDWIINYATVDSNTTTYIDNILLQCAAINYRVRAFQGLFYSNYSEIDSINVNLELVGSLATPGDALEVSVSDWIAFVSDNYSGLTLVDCFTPNQPQLVGSYDLADRTLSSFVVGNLAYVATHSGTNTPGVINKIDVLDPANPILIDFENIAGIPKSVYIDGDYAYIAEGENGLSVVYIAGSNMNFISNLPMNDARDVYVNSGYAYVADGIYGMKIIDVLNPQNPQIISQVNTTGLVNDVSVSGNYAFLADGETGMRIINVTDVYNPLSINVIDTPGFVYGVCSDDDHVYFVDKEVGFYVIDYTSVYTAYIVGFIAMETEPTYTHLNGSYVYITDNEGLKIVQVKP